MRLRLQRGAAGGVCGCLAEENGRRPSLGVTGGETLSGPSAQQHSCFFQSITDPQTPPSSWHAEAFSGRQGEVSQQLKVGGFEELEGKGVKKREKRRKEKAVLMFPTLNPKPCWVIRTATDQEPQVKLVGDGGPPNPYPYGLDHERSSTGGSRPENGLQVWLEKVTQSKAMFNAKMATMFAKCKCVNMRLNDL